MRWDRFFEDLEDQLDSEWEAERAALDSEAERLRISRVVLRDRLVSLALRTSRTVTAELADGAAVTGHVVAVGADWIALDPGARRSGATLVPLRGVVAIGMPHADVLASARDATAGAALSQRMTFGFVLRDLARKRVPVTVQLVDGRAYSGTIDRAGADHLDLALHDAGAARRADGVTGYRLVPFATTVSVRLDAPAALP